MRMRKAKKRQHETVLDIDVKVSLLQRKALQHAWIFPTFFSLCDKYHVPL